MTEPARRYAASAERHDDHQRTCPLCCSGVACPDGDDTAEAEYRAFRDWQHADPDTARAYRRRTS